MRRWQRKVKPAVGSFLAELLLDKGYQVDSGCSLSSMLY